MPGICRSGSLRCRPSSPPLRLMPTAMPARWRLRRSAPGLRVEQDLRNEKINYKVREHSLAKVPALLVVGRKEAADGTVSIRRLGKEQRVVALDAAIAELAAEAVPPDLRECGKRLDMIRQRRAKPHAVNAQSLRPRDRRR